MLSKLGELEPNVTAEVEAQEVEAVEIPLIESNDESNEPIHD
jgi:hypothetical protein